MGGYVTSTDTSFIKAESPWGPWDASRRVYITKTSCGGQHNMVAQLPSGSKSSKHDVWLYGSDLWTGDVNEGKAGSHWEPLQFKSNGDIQPINCNAKAYHMNVPTSKSPVTDVFETAAMHSGDGDYQWKCGFGIQEKSILYQVFQAPKSGNVTDLGVNIAQQA